MNIGWKKSGLMAAILVLVLAILAMSCAPAGQTPNNERVVKVGQFSLMTGALATTGVGLNNGMVDYFRLVNEQAGIDELPAFEEASILANYLPEYIEHPTTIKYGPIAISATRNNPRMQSQLSVFTINHKLKTQIEQVGHRQHVWRYLIPKDDKDSVLRELALLGIRRFQLFPELQTLGEIIGENC